MDLDFEANPMRIVRAGASLRFRNDLSGYYGAGDSLTFRNLWGEIVLFRFLTLRLGMVYENYTPLTLSAPVELLPLSNPTLSAYRDNMLYDAYLDRKDRFPFEGVTMNADFSGDGHSLNLRAIAAKLDEAGNAGNSFDRYLFGGHAAYGWNKFLETKATWVSLRDLRDTGTPVFNTPVAQDVCSLVFKYDLLKQIGKKDSGGIEAEFARSFFKTDASLTNTPAVSAGAVRVNAFVTLMRSLLIRVGWQAVPYEFVAPAAQTRIAFPGGTAQIFSSAGLDGFLFDYELNNRVKLGRNNRDLLNASRAMNEATPNRTGLAGQAVLNIRKAVKLSLDASRLSEMRPVSASNGNLRSYRRISGQFSLPTDEWTGRSFFPVIGGFLMMEDIDRKDDPDSSGSEREDCRIRAAGVNAEIRVTVKFSLTGLYQWYGITGRRIFDDYSSGDALKIAGYTPVSFGLTQTLKGGGAVWSFSRNIRIQGDYLVRAEEGRVSVSETRVLFTMMF
jgi:hypothetical protein